jgi:bifunctional non-homologous end joining protein LigD
MGSAPPPVMLATPGSLPSGPGWAYEFKWDGVRAVTVVREGAARFYARSGAEITLAYPELARVGAALDDTVLDGEVVVMDERGRPSFSALAERMHVRDKARAARLAATVPVTYLVFDLLRVDGRDMFDTPYGQRRKRLEQLTIGAPAMVPPAFDDGLATVSASQDFALEGIVAKRVDSLYRPGVRSPDWIKVKSEETAEFVIGGWRPGKRALGALLVGVPDPAGGGLVFRGRVGGGISAAAERLLLKALEPLHVKASPFGRSITREDAREAVWCRPELVVEVRYGNRTRDDRLRFPRYLRLRPDLTPDDVHDE